MLISSFSFETLLNGQAKPSLLRDAATTEQKRDIYNTYLYSPPYSNMVAPRLLLHQNIFDYDGRYFAPSCNRPPVHEKPFNWRRSKINLLRDNPDHAAHFQS